MQSGHPTPLLEKNKLVFLKGCWKHQPGMLASPCWWGPKGRNSCIWLLIDRENWLCAYVMCCPHRVGVSVCHLAFIVLVFLFFFFFFQITAPDVTIEFSKAIQMTASCKIVAPMPVPTHALKHYWQRKEIAKCCVLIGPVNTKVVKDNWLSSTARRPHAEQMMGD